MPMAGASHALANPNKRSYGKHGKRARSNIRAWESTAVKRRRKRIAKIVAEAAPMTVRQVFYQAVVNGIVEKTEQAYQRIKYDLRDMRFSGQLDWSDIVDNTRWQHKPTTFDSVTDALQETARTYRRNLWRDSDAYVEIWIEKDALTGVIYPVTSEYDVPLMPARGYASLSFLYECADDIKNIGKPAYIYHLGDYDPSGVDAANKIEQSLRQFAPGEEIHFERLALSREQIDRWKLPTRPTKQHRAKSFGDATSCELDALHPDRLRSLVRRAVERHLPRRQLDVLKAAEESERQVLKIFAEKPLLRKSRR